MVVLSMPSEKLRSFLTKLPRLKTSAKLSIQCDTFELSLDQQQLNLERLALMFVDYF